MGLQYRNETDEKETKNLQIQQEQNTQTTEEINFDKFTSDAFNDYQYTKSVYDQICNEYNIRILKKFAHLTKAKAQFPPYWNDDKNQPEALPLNQHNVCSGRYTHSINQVSLTYNSFFPNESYGKSLTELKIVQNPFGQAPNKQGKTQKDSRYVPEQASKEETASYMYDQARIIEQAYDNLIKNEDWAKAEHLKMVSDMMNYGVGIYFYDDPKSYRYKALDYTKCRFPTGSSIKPNGWEYVFIEHDMAFTDLVRKYNTAKKNPNSGWNKSALFQLLSSLISSGKTTTLQNQGIPAIDPTKSIDNVRQGFTGQDFGRVSPARIPVVSCYWQKENKKIAVNTFYVGANAATDQFLFTDDNYAEYFAEIFSVFPGDETEDEIRMVRGWGEKIHPLCHAYDRAFCKFLDHLDYSATMFVNMDPNDIHKKILHFGSINIGKIESVQNFPTALQPIIAGLNLLDAKIDSVTFTRGLNKTELMGDGRGAELASIILTVEGRIHKHLNARFAEHQSLHYRKNLAKIIRIALDNSKTSDIDYPEVRAKFTDYLDYYQITKKMYQYDDTSHLNCGLPSNWILVARKPDTSGIGNSTAYVVEQLRPFFSSLPEAGFRYMLARIIADAFGDEDMIQKLLPDSDLAKITTEADIQIAETQAAILTANQSDFDKEFAPTEEVDPKLSDAAKFLTLPASRENDHIVFLQVFLARVDDAVERMNRREFGRTTLHIWMYNLVSSAQPHVELLRQDQVRSQRPEAQELIKRFGVAFNTLRQVESQANADRAKMFDSYQQKLAQQEATDPKRMEAEAKLITARAKQAEVQLKFNTNNFQQFIDVQENKRAEEAHIVDQQLKRTEQNVIQIDSLNNRNGSGANGSGYLSQTDVGRPNNNLQ